MPPAAGAKPPEIVSPVIVTMLLVPIPRVVFWISMIRKAVGASGARRTVRRSAPGPTIVRPLEMAS